MVLATFEVRVDFGIADLLGEGVGFASPHGKSHQIFCRCAQKFPAPQLKTEERGSCDLLHAC